MDLKGATTSSSGASNLQNMKYEKDFLSEAIEAASASNLNTSNIFQNPSSNLQYRDLLVGSNFQYSPSILLSKGLVFCL